MRPPFFLMIISLIVLAIFILYIRTLNYYFLIDDNVRRWEYLYVVPEQSPHPSFYSTKPSKWRHLFLIITHVMNVLVINQLWGWKVAALFAFHPMCVTCAAWITGGYYSVTTFLTLTAFYFIHTYQDLIGTLIGNLFFTAALGSTITCLGFPFIFFFVSKKIGLTLFWPMLFYLFGKRFRTGFGIRNSGKRDPVTYRKIAVMTKVTAYYIDLAFLPVRTAFFREFGFDYHRLKEVRARMESFNKDFWIALGKVVCVFGLMVWINPLGAFWFFCTIFVFTQFKILGQFIAERYLYLPLVGVCLVLGTAMEAYPWAIAIIVALWAYRSHKYIPAFEKIETLYQNGINNYPECMTNYNNLAERLLHVGEMYKAFELLKKGILLYGDNFLCNCNMAAYYISLGHWEVGMLFNDKALNVSRLKDNAQNILLDQKQRLAVQIKKDEKAAEEIRKIFDAQEVSDGVDLDAKQCVS